MAKKFFAYFLAAIIAATVLLSAVINPAAAQGNQYPLTGLRFSSPEGSTYDAYWESNGRLWQPQLLSVMANQRVAHSVAIKLVEGRYVFNGVVCTIYVDNDREGLGSKGIAYGRGNGIEFNVTPKALAADEKTETVPVSWALVNCDGGASSGFDIWSVDFNTQPGVAPVAPPVDQTTVQQPADQQPPAVVTYDAAYAKSVCGTKDVESFNPQTGEVKCVVVVTTSGGSSTRGFTMPDFSGVQTWVITTFGDVGTLILLVGLVALAGLFAFRAFRWWGLAVLAFLVALATFGAGLSWLWWLLGIALILWIIGFFWGNRDYHWYNQIQPRWRAAHPAATPPATPPAAAPAPVVTPPPAAPQP